MINNRQYIASWQLHLHNVPLHNACSVRPGFKRVLVSEAKQPLDSWYYVYPSPLVCGINIKATIIPPTTRHSDMLVYGKSCWSRGIRFVFVPSSIIHTGFEMWNEGRDKGCRRNSSILRIKQLVNARPPVVVSMKSGSLSYQAWCQNHIRTSFPLAVY